MLFFVKGSLFYLFLTLRQCTFIVYFSCTFIFIFIFLLKLMINAYIIYCTQLIDINYLLDLRVRLIPTSKIHKIFTSHNFENNEPYQLFTSLEIRNCLYLSLLYNRMRPIQIEP